MDIWEEAHSILVCAITRLNPFRTSQLDFEGCISALQTCPEMLAACALYQYIQKCCISQTHRPHQLKGAEIERKSVHNPLYPDLEKYPASAARLSSRNSRNSTLYLEGDGAINTADTAARSLPHNIAFSVRLERAKEKKNPQ